MSDSTKIQCVNCNKMTNTIIGVDGDKTTLSCSECRFQMASFPLKYLTRLQDLEHDMIVVRENLIAQQNMLNSFIPQFEHISRDLREFENKLPEVKVSIWKRIKQLFKK